MFGLGYDGGMSDAARILIVTFANGVIYSLWSMWRESRKASLVKRDSAGDSDTAH